MSQKRALSRAISLAVNYHLFSHGDGSYRCNGKNDNVVLELTLLHASMIFVTNFHLFVEVKVLQGLCL